MSARVTKPKDDAHVASAQTCIRQIHVSGSARSDMPPMELKIVVDHTLELPVPDGEEQEVCPVVAYGQPIKGKVILSTKKGTKKTSFSGLELKLRSFGYYLQEGMSMPSEEFEIGGGAVAVPLVLETAKTYELEGELEVPFDVPASALPACDAYWGKGLFINHVLAPPISTRTWSRSTPTAATAARSSTAAARARTAATAPRSTPTRGTATARRLSRCIRRARRSRAGSTSRSSSTSRRATLSSTAAARASTCTAPLAASTR